MPADRTYHMSSEEFRRQGHGLVDWIADYLDSVEARPVVSQVKPGAVRSQLPSLPPQRGEPFEAVMNDVNEVIVPGLTHWQSPNFFAYFPANTSGPAILGELLSAGLGVQGMLWATSPACTELETLVLDWLVDMLDLPPTFQSTSAGGGVIQDTASSATLCAMLAARERVTGLQSNQCGVRQELVAYTSTQAHSSVEKSAKIAGIGSENLRLIDVDETFAMRPDQLTEAINRDRAAGRTPFFVCATVGTTSSGAIDPLRSIGEVLTDVDSGHDRPIWLHVDAAMAGTAAVCPEFRSMHDGVEFADSYTFNPHKWMFTNFDCNCFWITDRRALINALSILPEYLRNTATESGEVIDYRDWHVPLGRRFRALKLWFVIRHYGVEGLQHHVREHVSISQDFARWVSGDPRFEIAAPHPLNLVTFRHIGGDAINERLLHDLNATGRIYITHTRLNGLFTLRVSIGGTRTARRHVEAAWELIRQHAPEG